MRTHSIFLICSTLIVGIAAFKIKTERMTGPLDSKSPQNYKPFVKIGKNYYIVQTNDKLGWLSAEFYCLSYEAHLASIDSKEELNDLNEFLVGMSLSSKLWIGAYDNEDILEFKWIQSAKNLTVYRWDDGEPNGKNQRCVVLHKADHVIVMSSESCNKEYNFLCKSYTKHVKLTVSS